MTADVPVSAVGDGAVVISGAAAAAVVKFASSLWASPRKKLFLERMQ